MYRFNGETNRSIHGSVHVSMGRNLQTLRRSIASGVGLLLVVLAAPVSAETLVDALVAAYLNNPTLEAGRAQLRAVDENVPQALSGWRPTVEIDSSVGVNRSEINSANAETLSPWSGELSIVQPLYRGGQTVAGTEQAESEVRAERARLLTIEQDVLLATSVAYIDVLRDEVVVDLNQNNVQVLQRQLEATQDRFEVGEITRTDVAQAEARVSRSVSDRVQSEGNLVSSRASYTRLVGIAPGTLEPAPRLRDLPESEANAIDIAMENSPLLTAARADEEASRHAIDVSRGRLLPVVQLNGDISHSEEVSVSVDESDNYGVSAQVTIPLYQSGAVYSAIRQNREINSQRIVQMEGARRDVVEDVTQSWEALNTAQAEIQSRRDEVRAAEIALEGVRQESIVGARTTLDVLDAEQEFLDARVALVVAERDEFVASFELAASIGGLTARNLELPVELYDTQTHYGEVRNLRWGPDVPWR